MEISSGGMIVRADEIADFRRIGGNVPCMISKGGNPEHIGEPLPDRSSLSRPTCSNSRNAGTSSRTKVASHASSHPRRGGNQEVVNVTVL
jgi:hypothetical protein